MLRSLIVSLAFLFAAFLTAAIYFRPPSPPASPATPVERIRAALPDTDAMLVDRVAEAWGETAVIAVERCGEDGLRVLNVFGDEAAYCLEHQPEAFDALAKVVTLDPDRYRLVVGSWNRAILDWAQNGKLDRFLERLKSLPPARLTLVEACPDALPLLCRDDVPVTLAMLEKYGERAWPLFRSINWEQHPEDLERVAQALEHEGDLILDLQKDYGLPYALLLVPPSEDAGSKHLPDIVHFARNTLRDEETALALVLVNYDDIKHQLDVGIPPRDLEDAIRQFAALSPLTQEMALDHPHTLRLLSETWQGRKIGFEVLDRSGPAAADVIYQSYASDDRLKHPALVALAHLGPPALSVFERFHDYGPFQDLIKRCARDLMNPRDNPPAVVHAMHHIAQAGPNAQRQIDIYAQVHNLRAEVLAKVRGPLPEEAVLEWVPGYLAYRTVSDAVEGRHVTGGDVFWATTDAVTFVFPFLGPSAKAGKIAGKKAAQEALEITARKGISETGRIAAQKAVREAEERFAQSLQELALECAQREGADLARFGDSAGDMAKRRLEARTEGVTFGVADRSQDYLRRVQTGDINGKARLVEEIGVEGAQKYVASVGYQPLHSRPPRPGMGFDVPPCRDGDRIVVIEAKGGGAKPQTYYGHPQGTVEYAKAVAERTLRSPAASVEDRQAAEAVLNAAREDRLYVEVVQTHHVQGQPGLTRVKSVFGPNGPIPVERAEGWRTALGRTPGMSRAAVQQAREISRSLDLPSRIKQGEAVARRLQLGLWNPGSGPLAPRDVVRRGQHRSIAPGEPTPLGQVDPFTIALMERSL